MKSLNQKKIIYLTKIKKPFLMINSVKKIVPLKSGLGICKIKNNSWFFKSHFINDPVMPGTLVQESMLQTIVSILYSNKKFKNKICLIIHANTSFFSKVTTQNTLNIKVKIKKITKTKIEAFAEVHDSRKIKIASGLFKYFISYRVYK